MKAVDCRRLRFCDHARLLPPPDQPIAEGVFRTVKDLRPRPSIGQAHFVARPLVKGGDGGAVHTKGSVDERNIPLPARRITSNGKVAFSAQKFSADGRLKI